MLKTRIELEQQEIATLAPYAMKSRDSVGRVYKEPEDDAQTVFQRDRNRIIHCKAFRRLQAKTQVLVSYYGDHYRDRMTHSIEVAQIARDIARFLGLNEDLCECLALAHDLGHPPFGHGGEYALDEVMQEFGQQFEHNEQSRRIIEKLEKIYPSFDGLNVTKEVLDGLLKHNPHHYHTYLNFKISPHLEGQIVDLADEIAYTNHDIDDGIRSGCITVEQLGQFSLWQKAEAEMREKYATTLFDKETEERLRYRTISRMIGMMIADLQETTAKNLINNAIDDVEKVRKCKIKLAAFSETMQKELKKLRGFLMNNFYLNGKVAAQINRGKEILKQLFHYYYQHPDKMPENFIQESEALEIVVKDYIAGMTDHYAEEKWEEAFGK